MFLEDKFNIFFKSKHKRLYNALVQAYELAIFVVGWASSTLTILVMMHIHTLNGFPHLNLGLVNTYVLVLYKFLFPPQGRQIELWSSSGSNCDEGIGELIWE